MVRSAAAVARAAYSHLDNHHQFPLIACVVAGDSDVSSRARAGAEHVGQEEKRNYAGGQRPAQIFPHYRVGLDPSARPLGAMSSW